MGNHIDLVITENYNRIPDSHVAKILLSTDCSSCLGVKSCHTLFATPWTVAHQAPLFMEVSRQEYWSGLPFPSAGDLPNPGMEPSECLLPLLAYPKSHQEREGCYFTEAV